MAFTIGCCHIVGCNVARFAKETIKLCASHTGLRVDATFLTFTQNTAVEYFMQAAGAYQELRDCSASLPRARPPPTHPPTIPNPSKSNLARLF